jgi:Bacterial mobilisation protein (MobC)
MSEKGVRTGSETRKRTSIIGFRASSEERAEIEANAAGAGFTVGSYLRNLAVTRPRTRAVRRAGGDAALLARMLGQFGKIGSNLNQLAKKANSDGVYAPPELDHALVELRAAAKAILQALGGNK